MNAQEKLIEYGNKIRQMSNTINNKTAQEIIGMAMIEDTCILRTSTTKIVLRVTRQGKTITATETTISKTSDNEKVTSEITNTLTVEL